MSETTLTILGLLVTMLGLLVSILIALGQKRLLAWFLVISGTLVAPNALVMWVALEIFARLFAPVTTDVSLFVTRIALIVGAFSSFYPLIWGVRIYPQLRGWILSFPS